MSKEVFRINLNIDILTKLRDKINEQEDISYNKMFGNYRAWDKICAIMDRLDDTAEYLNGLELNTGKFKNSAFDFFDFMNNASVFIDCIKGLAKIFTVSDDKIKKTIHIFNKTGKDGKGTDERYFEYLRSLCSVHPVETSRHKRYQDNNFECSPYVLWNNNGLWNDDCDIYAVVYTSKDGELSKRVNIYISEIFDYIRERLNFVEDIIEAIEQYQKQVISTFKNKCIKNETEFDNYLDYLRNLEIEAKERYSSEYFYSFDYVINLLELEISNPKNKKNMCLYIEALKYAIRFEHNRIQNMSYEGFENNGLLYTEKNTETSLYNKLYSPRSGSFEETKYAYNLEKISYLSYESCYENKKWAYLQLMKACSFLEKHVSFENAKGDFEHYALVKLALYLECLENECLINKNIPNDLKYRKRLLTDEEIRRLYKVK